MLERYPGVRVELIGQNSSEVLEDLRRGRLEAAMIAIHSVDSEGIEITPGGPRRARLRQHRPGTAGDARSPPQRLAEAQLVMPETTWRATDSMRLVLRQMLHETGRNPQTRIEVEDVETAMELVGLGLADSVIPRARPSSCCRGWRRTPAGWCCGPRRTTPSRSCTARGATLSPAAQLMIELATKRIQAIAQAL